jgi:TM2 domain-containing membrane protein YozV
MNSTPTQSHTRHRTWFYTFKTGFYLLFFFLSASVYASDSYVAISDVNLRDGAGTNYKPLAVISKGDTVKLLEDTGNYWVKIQYKGEVGYTGKKFLQEIQIQEIRPKENNLRIVEPDDKSSFPAIFVGLLITIIVASVLDKSGKKHRSLSLTKFLSLFFGVLGFQKFYLGETGKGILSILFCWTFIPVLIGWIDFAKFASVSEDKFNSRFNRNHKSLKKMTQNSPQKLYSEPIKKEMIQQESSSFSRKEVNNRDHSIIDISLEKLDLSVEHSAPLESNHLQPPYWSHSYVYSYDEINYATAEQKKYYSYFKKKVLKGEFVDIQGYTNYAFILYFDLLKEYESHKDIKLLEEQFRLLGQICPRTRSYSLMSLQDLLRKRTDSYSTDKLKNLQEPSYQFEQGFSEYDPDAFKLGKKYKDKLGLNKQEIAWLNKFWNPSNVFISIEGCCIATIKQYLLIVKNLNKKLKLQNTSIAQEVDYFKEKIFEIKEIADSYWGYYDKSYMRQRVESEIYLTIFKRVENSVRESYGHKRKVGSNPYYEFEGEFETRIGNHVNELVTKYQKDIIFPDVETQIELNAQNVNRWKNDLSNLKDSFQEGEISNFLEGMDELEEANKKNPNIENIFFEASKIIAPYDKVQSLKYYAKYIYYDLKSVTFDNRELARTVQKSLFKTQEQLTDFKRIVAELIKTSDIEKALKEIEKIYIPKRKKIQLDKSKIKEAERKLEKTVKLTTHFQFKLTTSFGAN